MMTACHIRISPSMLMKPAFLMVFPNRDPNKGLKVPTTWPKFTTSGHQFLEINAKMNQDNVRQKMRMRFVHFWTSVLPSLQSVKMYE